MQDFAPNSLEEQWMPFTANRDFKANPRLVVKTEGVYLYDHHGGKVIDGSSGMFCSPAGHCRVEIVEAVHKQMQQLGYVSPFGTAHASGFALARRIAKLTPESINHVFFVTSGSEAVDTALKIAMAYHHACGDAQRLRFVSRERAYHGVSIGGVSLSGMAKNREAFPVVMPNVVLLRHSWTGQELFVRGQPEKGVELADDLERLCQNYGGSTIAAVFIEPVAGSTGILVPPKGYLSRIREICDRHGILLVFDEVICGFGRMGANFAADAFGVTPDIMTMAKALTNGAIPMGAVAVRDDIYEAITQAAPDGTVEFFHGYTYSAHPAACAAGIATLDLYASEDLFTRAAQMSEYFQQALWSLRDHPLVMDLRSFGMIAGVELHALPGSPGKRGTHFQKAMFWNGLHIKCTGDTALVAPPFIVERHHIDEIVEKMRKTLDEMLKIDAQK